MRFLPLLLVLVLGGCPSSELGDPSVQIVGALVSADGQETAFDAEGAGFLDLCEGECASIAVSFAVDGSDVYSHWEFASADLSEPGAGPLLFASVSWLDSDRFARQGEGSTAWGELPGGDIVIEDSCPRCGVAGSLDGQAVITVYEGADEEPSGEVLRVDTFRFDALSRDIGARPH